MSDPQAPDRTFTIRELCREFNVTPRALRFYEDKGLLNPGRRGANRLYTRRDRARLQLILRGKRVGLKLSELRELLDLHDKDGGMTQAVVALPRLQERITALEAQKQEIEIALTALRNTCASLQDRLEKGPETRADTEAAA